MTPEQARLVLATRTNGLLTVGAVPFASDLVAITAAVSRPPTHAFDAAGLARFPIRLDLETWTALRTLVDDAFATKGASRPDFN